jgi:lactate dehydrogenase-like 2-hydroxyacid dehydrogenase
MRVLVAGRRPHPLPGAVQVELDELLRHADAVFLAVPLTPQTRHLLDGRRLALLKPTAHLVSIAPDEVVDLAALSAALTAGTLGGAALDLVGDATAYRDVPRLVLTRRWGIRTEQARRLRAERWVGAVRDGIAAGLHPQLSDPQLSDPSEAPT